VKKTSTTGLSPGDFIQQMNLRSPITTRVYRCILNGFQRFFVEKALDKSTSSETIRQWLNDRKSVWPLHLVEHRARLVDRFLDWMVNKGGLANNPFAEIRTEYAQRSTAPIVRCLLKPDFRAALDALRPFPRFGSFLGPVMLEHINLMKAMGHALRHV
jgi:integrase/recombinase XerD